MRSDLRLVALLASWLVLDTSPAGAQGADSTRAVALAARPGGADSMAAKPAESDLGARRYLNACAGCHRLEGAKLNGPALAHVAAWPPGQLRAAIKRMEKNVGALSEEDLDRLGDFLRAPDARLRLSTEEERVRAQFAKKLAPANKDTGKRLFQGHQSLENGGMACVACHSLVGVGGRLGPDLTDAATRLGRTPLTSGIVNAAYRVMAPHYRKHPITQQEAAHIVEYLAQPSPQAAPPMRPGVLTLGTGGAVVAFLGLAFYYRRNRQGRGVDTRRRGV